MAQDNTFQEEQDLEIAEFLGTAVQAPASDSSVPDYDASPDGSSSDGSEESSVDLQITEFPQILKRLEEQPHTAFDNPSYYKTALSNEGNIAQRVHMILQKYINSKDIKDRGVFRQQLTTAFWEFLAGVARKAPGKLPDPKKYLLRFGILHPTFIDAKTRNFFATVIVENELAQPVYYLDEWFKLVGNGTLRVSTTDEGQVVKSNSQVQLQQLLEKAKGKFDGARNLLKAKDVERTNLENALTERIQIIMEHSPFEGLQEIRAAYSDSQKRVFSEIQEVLKNMLKSDRDLNSFSKDYFQAEEDVNILRDKIAMECGKTGADVQAVDTEFGTIRQMAKMTIGRQGNHFPILTREYFHCTPNDVAFRENVIAQLTRIESIDPEVFFRSYKNRVTRIAPFVILIPSYGDSGVCWEPFDRFNRATSRGRIAVPMYPKNLIVALLSAVADLRWQVAKEKASYYWMEEGLTGNYYQWFSAHKLKGDLKDCFIEDYITWMTKESDGIQKLDKEVRGIFWRYMPFAQPVKEKLKNRSFIYQDLYQRDINRAMSDGY